MKRREEGVKEEHGRNEEENGGAGEEDGGEEGGKERGGANWERNGKKNRDMERKWEIMEKEERKKNIVIKGLEVTKRKKERGPKN